MAGTFHQTSVTRKCINSLYVTIKLQEKYSHQISVRGKRRSSREISSKLTGKVGGYFSLKLTGKLGRDFSSSKLADRRNQKGETTTGMLALLPSFLLWSVFPFCSGGRYRRSAEWGADLAPGPYCASRGEPQCCTGRDDKCSVEVLGSLCYCDSFCTRTAEDCCPDYDVTCMGIAPVTKGIF